MLHRKSLISVFILSTLVLSWWIVSQSVESQTSMASSSRVKVKTVKVQEGQYFPQYFSYGKVVLTSPDIINAPISDQVRRVDVKLGQKVNKNDVLLEFNDKLVSHKKNQLDVNIKMSEETQVKLSNAISHTEHQLKLYTKQAKLSEKQYNRSADLYEKKHISKESLERSHQQWLKYQQQVILTEQSLDASKQDLKNIRHQLQLLQDQNVELNRQHQLHIVKAPNQGVVSELFVTPGQTVPHGQPLLRLISNQSLKLKVFLPNQLLGHKFFTKTRLIGLEKLTSYKIVEDHRPGHMVKTALFDLPLDHHLVKGDVKPVLLESLEFIKGYRVPERSIYDDQYVYLLRGNVLKAEKVNILAAIEGWDSKDVIIQSNRLVSGDHVLLSRLPNVIDGLEVEVIQP